MSDPILTLGIDSRPAQTGSREFGRSIDDIKRKAGEGVAATDNMRGAFDRLKDNAFGLRGEFSRLMGVFSATAVFAAFVRQTGKAESAMAQLESVISSTGGAAGLSIIQLEKLSAELQRTSIYGDDMIKGAETRLLSYTSIVGTNFPRAMRIVLDQSARLNMSLTQSAEVIGRALDAPSKAAAALSRQGFAASFTNEIQKTIKALEAQGKTAEAQTIVMDILEESYAGAAKAARETLPGALDAAGEAFGDLFTLSTESSRGIADAVNMLTDNIHLIPDAVQLAGVAIGLYFTPAVVTASAAIATKIGLLVTYNALLARAAGAQAVFATAAAGVAAALPIAVLAAATYAIYEMIDGNDKAIEVEKRFAAELAKTSDLQYEYITASRTRRSEIRAHVKDNIVSYQAEQKAYILMMQDYMKMSTMRLGFEELMGRARNEIFAPMGVVDYGITPGQVAAQLEGSLKNIKAMQDMLKEFDKVDSGKYSGRPSGSVDEKAEKKRQRDLDRVLKDITESYGLIKPYEVAVQAAETWREDTLKILRQSGGDYEKYVAQVEEIFQGRLREALDKSRDPLDGLNRAVYKYVDEASNGAANVERVFNAAATGTEDALVKAFTGASSAMEAFRDLASSVASDLTRMFVRENITAPLFEGLNNGKGLSSLLSFGGILSSIFHDGGVVGSTNAPQRLLPASTFRNAPRFHSGLMPDEFPAILQKGEAVIPKGAKVAGGQTLQVNNTISIEMSGGGGNNANDTQRIQQAVQQGIEAGMADFIRRQQKVGGMLNNRVAS